MLVNSLSFMARKRLDCRHLAQAWKTHIVDEKSNDGADLPAQFVQANQTPANGSRRYLADIYRLQEAGVKRRAEKDE